MIKLTLLLLISMSLLISCTYKPPVEFKVGPIAPTPIGCKQNVDC
jgi:hypothetical protein